jgi:hypothetical protein
LTEKPKARRRQRSRVARVGMGQTFEVYFKTSKVFNKMKQSRFEEPLRFIFKTSKVFK